MDLFNLTNCNCGTTGELRTDVADNDNDFTIIAEVPGLIDEQIDVSFEDGFITITADYGDADDTKRVRTGKFSKTYEVQNVEVDNIEAKLENGLLRLTLPKSEQSKARKITISKS